LNVPHGPGSQLVIGYYLAEPTGYAKDSRELWQAAKKKAKVPIQVVKA